MFGLFSARSVSSSSFGLSSTSMIIFSIIVSPRCRLRPQLKFLRGRLERADARSCAIAFG